MCLICVKLNDREYDRAKCDDSPDRLFVGNGTGNGLNDWLRDIHVARKCSGIIRISRIVIYNVGQLWHYFVLRVCLSQFQLPSKQ